MDKLFGGMYMRRISISLDLRNLPFNRLRRFVSEYPRDGRLTLYFLMLVYSTGIACGALLIRANMLPLGVREMTVEKLREIVSLGFFRVFSTIFVENLLFFVSAFFIGLFIPGCVLAPVLIFARGVLFGSFAGYLYSAELMSGIMKNLIYLFPCGVLSALVLALALREAMSFSSVLFKSVVLSNETSQNSGFKLYLKRFLIILLLLILPALLSGGIIFIFSKKFVL